MLETTLALMLLFSLPKSDYDLKMDCRQKWIEQQEAKYLDGRFNHNGYMEVCKNDN